MRISLSVTTTVAAAVAAVVLCQFAAATSSGFRLVPGARGAVRVTRGGFSSSHLSTARGFGKRSAAMMDPSPFLAHMLARWGRFGKRAEAGEDDFVEGGDGAGAEARLDARMLGR